MKLVIRLVGAVFALLVVLVAAAAILYGRSDIDPEALKSKYTNLESEFVTLNNGLVVHVRDQGPEDGDTIVLVHGSTSSLHTWEPWIGFLKDKYRIVSMTLAGHGLTGPDPDHDYSMTGQARLVHEVLQQRSIERYTIVGSSMGGFIAWVHTILYPDSVDRLVLIGASGFPHDGAPSLTFQLMRMPVTRDLLRYITPRSSVERATKLAYNNNPVVDDALVDRYYELLLRKGNRHATAIRSAKERDYSIAERMDEIGVPTLLMWGKHDALVPVEDAEKFAQAIPQAQTIIYDDLGHIPFEEAPERTVRDFEAFLRGELTSHQ